MELFNIKNFYDDVNTYLLPPYIETTEREAIISKWKALGLKNHTFLLSSGTSSKGELKSYAIKKEAIIKNAQSVNRFLGVLPSDNWLLSLPFYHIGGFSILVRAKESQSNIFALNRKQKSWCPRVFYQQLLSHSISLTSLVPTQLFDLVSSDIEAPRSLKGIFIGGDLLHDELKKKALALGWPLIETYGMTELSSQLASSFVYEGVKDSFLEVLDIHKVSRNEDKIFVQSDSLFTAEIIISGDEVIVRKQEGALFALPDRVLLKEVGEKQYLKSMGRLSDEFKIKGRLYNFKLLNNQAQKIFLKNDMYLKVELVVVDDEREGKSLELWFEKGISQHINRIRDDLQEGFPKAILIKRGKVFPSLERNKLGKLKRHPVRGESIVFSDT